MTTPDHLAQRVAESDLPTDEQSLSELRDSEQTFTTEQPAPREAPRQLDADQALVDQARDSDPVVANAAYTLLMARHLPSAVRFISRRLRFNQAEVEEATHETCVRAFFRVRLRPLVLTPHLANPTSTPTFAPYLMTIAVNVVRTWWRKHDGHEPVSLEAWCEQRSNRSRAEQILVDASSARQLSDERLDSPSDEEVEQFCQMMIELSLASLHEPADKRLAAQRTRMVRQHMAAYAQSCGGPVLQAFSRLPAKLLASYFADLVQVGTYEEIGQRLGGIPANTVAGHVFRARQQIAPLLAYALAQEEYSETDIAKMLGMPGAPMGELIARGRDLYERYDRQTRQKKG